MSHSHFIYHGHCTCGQRHTYDGGGVYIPDTDYLRLDNPIECKCGERLFIFAYHQGKTFLGGEAAKDSIYLHEQRNVPRIHQNASTQTNQQKRQKYWFAREEREAGARYAANHSTDRDTMQDAPAPNEHHIPLSNHPARELLSVVATVILAVLFGVYIWSLLLH